MDDASAGDVDSKQGGTDRFTGLMLALIGAGCLVWAAISLLGLDSLLGSGSSDGRVTVEAQVASVESTFRWNPATRKNELVSIPTVEFVDPGSGQIRRVRMSEKLRVGEGDSVSVSLRPGSPQTAQLETRRPVLAAGVGVVFGLSLLALGVSMAVPSAARPAEI